MNNDKSFISLRAFAHESLGLKMRPTHADIEMSMNMSSAYARHFAKVLNEKYDISAFTCKDNGISKSIHCILEKGSLDIVISEDIFKNSTAMKFSKVEEDVTSNNETLYNSYSTFTKNFESLISCEKIA